MGEQLTLNELSGLIVDAAFQVHTALGPGIYESVYERALCYELDQRCVDYRQQVPVPVVYKGRELGEGYRADLLVDARVLVELKSVEKVSPVHKKQLLTYLRLLDLRLGLLLNFGARLLKDGVFRVANGVEDT